MNQGGRPRKFPSPGALEGEIQAYFYDCDSPYVKAEDGDYYVQRGKVPYTVSGLVRWLGVSRQTLLNYQYESGYAYVIQTAKRKIGASLGRQLLTPMRTTFVPRYNIGW